MSRQDYYDNLNAERGRGPRRGEQPEEAGWESHGHHEHGHHEHGHHEHGWGRGPFGMGHGPFRPPFFPWALFFGPRGPFGRGFGRGFGWGWGGPGFGRGWGGPGFDPENEEGSFRGGPDPRREWRRGHGGGRHGRRHGWGGPDPHGPDAQEWREHQIAHLEHVQQRLERHLAEVKGALEQLQARREPPAGQDTAPSGEDAPTTRI